MSWAQKILLVGCGRMGSALLAQWKKNTLNEIFVLDPQAKGSYATLDNLPVKHFNMIVLAVKPQIVDEVLRELTSRVTGFLLVSIAAGKTLKYMEEKLSEKHAIIRAMPNTPAMVGKAMTIACANANVTTPQKAAVKTLFETSGKFEWVDNELGMDAVTAVSGSGPAYVFLLIEAMAKAGIAQGLSAELAMRIARQTVIGAAGLAENQPQFAADTLRKFVTSPGGTTEAALNVLMQDNALEVLFEKAIAAAAEKSKSLV